MIAKDIFNYCKEKNYEKVKEILDNDKKLLDKNLLIESINNDDLKMVKLLLSYKCLDLKKNENEQYNILYYCYPEKYKIFKCVFDYDNNLINNLEFFNFGYYDGYSDIDSSESVIKETILMDICYFSDCNDEFKYLLSFKNLDVNLQNERGDTALHIAVKNKQKFKVKKLLERDDINIFLNNNKNEDPYFLSISKNNVNIIQYFNDFLKRKNIKLDYNKYLEKTKENNIVNKFT